MLSTNVKTTSDLMSIALQAEREAIRRYSQFASEMKKADNQTAAGLFERMVFEEQEHERLLLKWMEQENIVENSQIDPISWSDPQVSTTYNDEARDPYQSTPYRALAFAVHNEEIAFRFYTHVAANSENEAVRKYAEILAREELGHAALLRAERRLAYHAERKINLAEPRLDPKAIHNESDMLAAAIQIDSYLVDAMNEMRKKFPEIDLLANETRQRINSHENTLTELKINSKTTPGDDIIANLKKLKHYNEELTKTANDENLKLQQLCACCDRSFAFYDSIVETTEDEIIMLSAQKLTESALDRIGVFKRALGDSYLSD